MARPERRWARGRGKPDSRRRGRGDPAGERRGGTSDGRGWRTASQVVGRVTASRPRTGAAIVTHVVDAA